jgi:hypothetical protein
MSDVFIATHPVADHESVIENFLEIICDTNMKLDRKLCIYQQKDTNMNEWHARNKFSFPIAFYGPAKLQASTGVGRAMQF